jgi:glycosyltransferase involved in cell wall biosynthesis
MSGRTQVSVILPVFNREGSVRRAVDSVLRQTFEDLELIVVDDCSTDESVAAVDAVEDRRLSVVRCPENRGAAAARNLGVSHARGDWIAFQDSDDEWLPRKLELQLALADDSPDYVAIYCGMLIVNELPEYTVDGARLAPRYYPDPSRALVSGDLSVELLRGSLVSTQTLMVRRRLLVDLGGFDETLRTLEDWDLAIRIAQTGNIGFVDEPLVLQVFSTNSITRHFESRLAAQSEIADKHSALYARHPEILAALHYRLSGGYRYIDRPDRAIAHMATARTIQPTNLRFALMHGVLGLARRAGAKGPLARLTARALAVGRDPWSRS